MTAAQESVRFVNPDRHHGNFGAEIFCRDAEKIQQFADLCYEWFGPTGCPYTDADYMKMRNQLQPFFQGGFAEKARDWRYVEFWCEKSEENIATIWKFASAAAELTGLPLSSR